MKSRVIASSAALLLSFSILASACGGSDSGAAAKVNGVELKKSDLLAELKAYKDNKNIDPSALGVSSFEGDSKGSYNADFVRTVLGFNIQVELVHQDSVKKKFTLDDSVKKFADGIAYQIIGTKEAFDSLPKDVQTMLNYKAEEILNYRFQLAGVSSISDASLQKLFDADPKKYTQICPSHILVATEDEAKAVATDLKNGTKFADEAKLKSTDTGSKDSGGELRDGTACFTDAGLGTFVPEFADGVRKATVGVPTDPIKSQFGYHIILVTENRSEFAALKDAIPSSLLAESNDKFQTEMEKAWADAKISVNARYGEWDASSQSIVAKGSAPTTVKGATTTVPAAAGATTTAGASTSAAAAGATTSGS